MRFPLLLLSLMFVTPVILRAQHIDSLLDAYDKKVPQEKIHLHFDNSLYVPGQTIWFKAYLLKDVEPSELSKNLYIDWFDTNGKLVYHTSCPIINTTATGSFTLPEKYQGSAIQVSAYTKWMSNFDSSFFFHQVLPVTQKTNAINTLQSGSTTSLRFFPEGGEMIENVTGFIAYKAVNSAGLPITVSGTVADKNKNIVARFASEHDGMGKISLKPLPGETYTAQWTDPTGASRTTVLPPAKNTGVVLTMQNEAAIRLFSVERSANAADNYKKLMIIGSMNQQVAFKLPVDLTTKTKISATIPAVDFPSGVLQLTVFDQGMQPVSERIVFVNNDEYRLQADLLADSVDLTKRGKNSYEIKLSDTLPVSISVSVTDGAGSYDSSRNIFSQLLLSSELRGTIYNPAYYFSGAEDSIAHHLDLVMLTNGWRRFVWNDVLTGATPALRYTRDSLYLTIAGKIEKLGERKLKQTDVMNLILVGKDSTKQFLFPALQMDGSFREENILLYDTTKVFYRLNKVSLPARSSVSITTSLMPYDLKKIYTPLLSYQADTVGLGRSIFIESEQRRLDSLQKLTTLKDVVVTTRVRTKLEQVDERYSTGGLFEGLSGNVQGINVLDDASTAVSSGTVFDYIKTRLPNGGKERSTGFKNIVTMYYLDEQEVDYETLSLVRMNTIAYIKHFKSFAGNTGNGPALAVYTKKWEDISVGVRGLDKALLAGYSPVKEFYSPDYAQTPKNFTSDLRRTLYWNAEVLPDEKTGKRRFSFYNNDVAVHCRWW